ATPGSVRPRLAGRRSWRTGATPASLAKVPGGCRVIKYLGSKRRLVPVLGRLLTASGARTALDLFTGTTRVAQEFCRRGAVVTAADLATYSEVLAQCYVATDAATVDPGEVHDALSRLEALEPRRGYFTRTFCERARYLRPENGMRVDAIRDGIDAW